MNSEERGVRVPPTGGIGFAAAATVNLIVAVAFWFAATATYGFSGYGAISYHYEEWMWPVGTFLGVVVVAGAICLGTRGWRRFGAGLVAGAVMVALLDLAWTFVYFVSQGS